MARRKPAGRGTPRDRGVVGDLPPVESVLELNLDLVERLVQQDTFVELDIRKLIDELKDEETKDPRKKEILKEIFGDLYFLAQLGETSRSNLEDADKQVLAKLLPLIEAQAKKLQINTDALKQEIDQDIAELTEELANKNKIKVTKEKHRLKGQEVVIEEVGDDYILLRNDQYQTFRIPKASLKEGDYEFISYGEVEKEGEDSEWPIPEAGEARSIVYEGKHVGEISTRDGNIMTIVTLEGRRIITSANRAADRMKKLFEPKPEQN